MKTITRAKITSELAREVETLARDHVNTWIEQGMLTADMKDRAELVAQAIQSLMLRDIDLWIALRSSLRDGGHILRLS